MSQILTYTINPTNLIPNSPKPLLHYKNCFLHNGKPDIKLAYDTFTKNNWETQWVAKYGHYQRSHYHAATHEAMIVLSGPGIIRWGTADLDDDPHSHTYGNASEKGAIYTDASPGDLFIVPAGVAHKSYHPSARNDDAESLTGGGVHGIGVDDPRSLLGGIQEDGRLEGFVMMGAYPKGLDWGWSEGGDHVGRFEEIWNVQVPGLDPVFGENGGIAEYWKERKAVL